MGTALLVTGAPGAGKTTLVRALVAALPGRAGGSLTAAVRTADLIVVDEIGKMELCSPRFVEALEAALVSPKPILGTILQAPHPWLDGLKRRHNVELYRLTERNREDLTDALLARLGAELRG